MGKNDVEFKISAKNLSRKELKILKKDLKAAGVEVKAFNKSGAKMGAIGAKMKTAGRNISIGAGIAGAAIGLLTKQFATFENGIGRVAALINKDLIPTMDKFGAGVEKTSIDAATGVDELNQSLFDLISGGVKEADALKILEFSAKGARGAYSDLNSVVTGNIAIMNSFKIGAEGVPRIMDQINLAADKGITTFGKLGRNIGKVAATAAAYKITSGDLLAAVSATTTTGISTEQSVTQVKALLNAITTPTTEATKALDILQKGVPAADRLALSVKSLQSEGLLNYFNRLQKITGGSAIAIKALFGANQEASNGLNVLIQKSKLFNETANEMNNVGDKGALSMRKFAIASQTAQFKLDQTKQEIAKTARALGKELLPHVLKFLNYIKLLLPKIRDFVSNNKALVGGFAAFAVAGTAVAAVLGPTLLLFGQLLIIAPKLIGAVKLLNVAVMANPWIAAGVAIVGVAIGIKKVLDHTKKLKKEMAVLSDEGLKHKAADGGLFESSAAKKEIERRKQAAKILGSERNQKGLTGPNYAGVLPAALRNGPPAQVKKEEKKKTAIIKDEIDAATKAQVDAINKQLAAELAANKKLKDKTKETAIDLFGPGLGFVTDSLSSALSGAGGKGFIGKNIPGGSTTTKKSININKLELPNVTNTTEFIEEMNRKSDSLSFAG